MMLRGKCQCGQVRYEIDGPARQIIECHCETCRRLTGGVWQVTGARMADVTIADPEAALKWYRSSETIERGFCGTCSSILFVRRDGVDRITITAGTLDQPTGLHLMMRIFTDDRADYNTDSSGDGVLNYPGAPPPEKFDIPNA